MKYSKAIAANTDFLTAQAFVFEKDNLLAAFIISASGEDIFTKVRAAGLTSQEMFLSSGVDIPGRVEEVAGFLKSELVSAREAHILIVVCQENALYLEGLGRVQTILKRGDKQINLLSGSNQLISGFVEKGDKLLLLGARMIDVEVEAPFWDQGLIHSLFESPLEEFEDQLEMYLQTHKEEVSPVGTVLFENPPDVVPKFEAKSETPLHPKRNLFNRGFLTRIPKKTKLIILGVLVAIIILGAVLLVFNSQKQESRTQPTPETTTSQSAAIQNSFQITDWPLFLSLDLIKSEFSSDRLSYSIDGILVLDRNQKSLVALSIGKKSNQVLAGANNLGQASAYSVNGDKAFVFSADKGVYRVDLISGKGVTAAKPDDEWGRIADIYAFAGNFYLLDTLKNQIWKYVPIESGYADKNPYIKDANVDLVGAFRLQIDASVWVLKPGPEIIKYTNGTIDSFSVAGLDKNLGKLKSFFVSSDTEKIYFLDTDNSRVVVLEKSGKYFAQYIGDKFATADDLVVDEMGKKLYLLEGNKIFQIELK